MEMPLKKGIPIQYRLYSSGNRFSLVEEATWQHRYKTARKPRRRLWSSPPQRGPWGELRRELCATATATSRGVFTFPSLTSCNHAPTGSGTKKGVAPQTGRATEPRLHPSRGSPRAPATIPSGGEAPCGGRHRKSGTAPGSTTWQQTGHLRPMPLSRGPAKLELE